MEVRMSKRAREVLDRAEDRRRLYAIAFSGKGGSVITLSNGKKYTVNLASDGPKVPRQ